MRQTARGRIIVYIVTVLVGMVLLFVITNWGYLVKEYKYRTTKPQPTVNNPPQPIAEKIAPNRVIVPSLSIDAPLQYVEVAKESVFQEALAFGVVQYPGTAKPGQPGNVYIFGHSSDFAWAKGDYKTVFATLPHIEVGAEIILSSEDGTPYTYIVRETKVVTPEDLSVLAQDPTKKTVTLQTSYPLGTALKRFLAIGKLQE